MNRSYTLIFSHGPVNERSRNVWEGTFPRDHYQVNETNSDFPHVTFVASADHLGKTITYRAVNDKHSEFNASITLTVDVAFGPAVLTMTDVSVNARVLSDQKKMYNIVDKGTYKLKCTSDVCFPNMSVVWIYPGIKARETSTNRFPSKNTHGGVRAEKWLTLVAEPALNGKQVACVATNTREHTLTRGAALTFSMIFGPTTVYVTAKGGTYNMLSGRFTVRTGVPSEITCETDSTSDAAIVKWSVDPIGLVTNKTETKETLGGFNNGKIYSSQISFKPDQNFHKAIMTRTATNADGKNTVSKKIDLNVIFGPSTLTFADVGSVKGELTATTYAVLREQEHKVECRTDAANPQPELLWIHDVSLPLSRRSQLTKHVQTDKLYVYDKRLAIIANPEHNGCQLTCKGVNAVYGDLKAERILTLLVHSLGRNFLVQTYNQGLIETCKIHEITAPFPYQIFRNLCWPIELDCNCQRRNF